ncbi:MAG: hypothetical protein ACI9EF_001404 [Pseudohongiellaceae bacterium]|jgi:hypothetical protein
MGELNNTAEKPRIVDVAAAARRAAPPRNDGQRLQAAIRPEGSERSPHASITWRRCPGSTRPIALLGSVGVRSLSIVRGGFFGGESTSALATPAGWATMVRLTRQCSGRAATRPAADRQNR